LFETGIPPLSSISRLFHSCSPATMYYVVQLYLHHVSHCPHLGRHIIEQQTTTFVTGTNSETS